jgi:short-subunit dehydrogenase
MKAPIFKDAVVIVTGASRGIGRELARQLASQGARLALAARHQPALESAAAECQGLGGQAIVIPTDVSQEKACAELVQETVERFGRIDMLINNAGITMWAEFDQVRDLSMFEQVMRVNYLGSLYTTYYALPYLKQTRGRIVGVCSLAGRAGIPSRSGYSASKHAMAGFFDALRIELDSAGVSVSLVYPGFVATGSQERGFGADGQPLGKNPIRLADAMTPEKCAAIILKVAARRQREEVMTLRGKLAQWIKLISPGIVDRLALKAIQTGR